MFDFTDPTAKDFPYRNSYFEVEIGGEIVAGFTDISGLNVQSEIVEYREGGVNEFTHKLPGQLHASNVVLSRGLTDYEMFFKWLIESTTTARTDVQQNIVISLSDKQGTKVWGWEFRNAYPVRWRGPRMVSGGVRVALEAFEFTYEELATVSY